MIPPTVATVHTSSPIDSIDLRHVAHLDQVEMTLWSRRRLVQTLSLPIESAEALAAQLHLCVRTVQAEQEADRGTP